LSAPDGMDEPPPSVNWDQLFKTGELNIDEHEENEKARRERAEQLRSYIDTSSTKKSPPEAKKVDETDRFKVLGYGQRRDSMVKGMKNIESLMVELKLSPPASPTKVAKVLPGPRRISLMDEAAVVLEEDEEEKKEKEEKEEKEEKAVVTLTERDPEPMPMPKKKKKKTQPKPPGMSEIKAAKKKVRRDKKM
jgi:hypothetical protein